MCLQIRPHLRNMRYFALSLFLLPLGLCAQQTSVLFIGNSYTYVNDLPNTLRQLALSLGDTVTVASSTPGGYTFQGHTTLPATLDAINSQPWDFVVLQEQSQLGALPPDVTTTEASATTLVGLIEANYECTYPVFYMTWGRQNGDAQNCASFPFMCTYDGMQQGLRENFIALAEGNDGYTAPVGAAWKVVRDTQPTINLYDADGSHPSPAGTYLAACVFYCTLFQQDCVDATFNGSIDAASAAILRGIASSTVLDEPLTWNLYVPNGTDATSQGSSSNGPNDVTYYHAGAGTHLWTCSDGQSSTEANPTFFFFTSGQYTMTHTYTDPCGNTDTVSWPVDIIVSGVGEFGLDGSRVRAVGHEAIEVMSRRGAVVELFDLQGRSVVRTQLRADLERIACPVGAFLYRISDALGRVQSGKVVVE